LVYVGEGAQAWFVRVKGSGLVCVGVGAQVWFAQVKGLRFGLCRCRGSGFVCIGKRCSGLVYCFLSVSSHAFPADLRARFIHHIKLYRTLYFTVYFI
jgi:hypothetical protein